MTYEPFAAALTRSVYRRAHRLGLDDLGERFPELVQRTHESDVFLCAACDAGVSRAWETLVAQYTKGLVALARRRGGAPSEAEDLVANLWGDLSLAPANGSSRTRLGAYDGAGKLFAWLATILIKRSADEARRRKVTTFGDRTPEIGDDGRPGSFSQPDDPAELTMDSESAKRIAETLRAAWDLLEDREALALSYKYRNGLRQVQIAQLLGVSETRVSRTLSRAIEKLQEAILAVQPAADEALDRQHLWDRVREDLHNLLQDSTRLDDHR